MNIGKMMKQAQEMQGKMQKIQQEIALMSFEASMGGGAVTVKASGDGKVTSVSISEEILRSGDAETLSELILAAVNSALEQGHATAQKKMGALTAGLGLPGL